MDMKYVALVIVFIVAFGSLGIWTYYATRPVETVTLRFLCGDWADPPMFAFGSAIVEAFNEDHPNIQVSLEVASWDTVYTKLIAGIEAGRPPDLVFSGASGAGILYENGYALPVTDLINEVGEEDWVHPARVIFEDEDYMIPVHIEPMGLYLRKDWFDAKDIAYPLKTWDELLDAASMLTEDTDNDGEIDRWGIALPLGTTFKTSEDIWSLLRQSGQILSSDGKTVVFDTPAMRDALSFWKDLAQYSAPASIGWGWGEVRNVFKIGAAAMHFYQGRTMGEIWRDYPDLMDKIEVQLLPALDPEDYGTTEGKYYGGPEGFMIVKASKHIEEAKEFIRYFVGDRERLIKYLHTVPYHEIPTLYSVLNDPAFLDHPIGETRPDLVQTWLDIGEVHLADLYQSPGDEPLLILPVISHLNTIGLRIQEYIFQDVPLDQVMNEIVTDLEDQIEKFYG